MEGDKSVTDIANISSTEKDNGNVIVGVKGAEKFIQVPFNKKDKYFMNPTDFIKFVKAVEQTVRKSAEYSRYIAYLRNDVGLRSCALFHDIDDSIAPLELHHGPIFNLYDIVEIQIAYLYKNGDRINTMNVAHHILEDHFKNIIQVVSLSEMAHKGWHAYQKLKNKENAKFFLSIDCAFGDLKAFVEKYHDAMTMQHVMKLRRYFKEYDEYKRNNNDERPNIFTESVTNWADKFNFD